MVRRCRERLPWLRRSRQQGLQRSGLVVIAVVAIVVLALLWRTAAAQYPSRPQRIVSLNLCTDELLLRLAEPSRIASVTFLARDPNSSAVATLAAQVPIHYGGVEEVLAQRPDLALAAVQAARAVTLLLRRADVPIFELPLARSFADIEAQIATMADAVGARERGDALIADIRRRLALVRPPGAVRPKALILNPNGFTVGAQSLAASVLEQAGFENLATRLGIEDYGRLPLETVVLSGADLLIVNADRDGPPSLATDLLRHPALARMVSQVRTVVLPSRLWTCGGPGLVDAVEQLGKIAAELREIRNRP